MDWNLKAPPRHAPDLPDDMDADDRLSKEKSL